MAFIFPIGLGGGFYAPARANSSLRSLSITCRGKKTPQHTKSSHKKKCCGIEVIFDLSEDENEWNHFLLCSYGNYASYEVSRDIMFQNKSYNAVYAGDHYMYPFMYCGVYEDPILIDLNPCRETYKAMFYYSPEVTLSENPIMIYDSIESWIKTIIQCYKQRIYHIDRNGFLQYDRDREPKLSREINPKSVFWKLFD